MAKTWCCTILNDYNLIKWKGQFVKKNNKFRKSVYAFALFSTILLADDIEIEVEDPNVNIHDPIEVNIYVTTTVNQQVDQWESGDILTLNQGSSTTTWIYSPMYGRFAPYIVTPPVDDSVDPF